MISHINPWYYEIKDSSYPDFIKRILTHLELILFIILRRPRLILEIGSGSSTLSCFLSHYKISPICLDINIKSGEIFRKNVKKFYAKNIHFIFSDAFHLPFKESSFDLTFSTGFMEHFTNNDISFLINEQKRVTNQIFYVVPSNHYHFYERGDERHLSPNEWTNLITTILKGSSESYRLYCEYYKMDLKKIKDKLLYKHSKPLFIITKLIVSSRRNYDNIQKN